VQQVIVELCSIRAYTADELAMLLGRNKKWVSRSYLSPLLRAEILEYTIPGESPASDAGIPDEEVRWAEHGKRLAAVRSRAGCVTSSEP